MPHLHLQLSPAVDAVRDHVLGPSDAPVTLLEYGDFERPFCGRAYPAVQTIRRLLATGSASCFVTSRVEHPHARHAAEAAEGASAQGRQRFWAMHDMLFEHQAGLKDRDLVGYAAEIGLDVDRFQRDLAEHRYLERVHADVESAARSGAHGTPTFSINGINHEGLGHAR